MFKRFIKNAVQENRINGCKVIERSKRTKDFPFCSHVLWLNRKNQIGIEYNKVGIRKEDRIRIDGVKTSDERSFIRMMNDLIEHAKGLGYCKLMFCDSIPKQLLEMFVNYGFSDKTGDPNAHNHYLYLEITEK